MQRRSRTTTLCLITVIALFVGSSGDARAHLSVQNETGLAYLPPQQSANIGEMSFEIDDFEQTDNTFALHGPLLHRPLRRGWYRENILHPFAPTLRSMQNNKLQSHQWRGDYRVHQPLYSPTFGYHGTRWRPFHTPQWHDANYEGVIHNSNYEGAIHNASYEGIIEVRPF